MCWSTTHPDIWVHNTVVVCCVFVFCSVAYIAMPLFVVVILLMAMLGIVMYAIYADCDPLMSGQIARRDQVRLTVGERAQQGRLFSQSTTTMCNIRR